MCSCNKSKQGGTGQKWLHLDAQGKLIQSYSSETDARRAASSQSGTRVRPA